MYLLRMSQTEDIETYLRRHLSTRLVGRRLHCYTSLPSTMDTARDIARKGKAEGAAVIADIQTAGRGRLGRYWLTPGSNLAISVVLQPSADSLPGLIMIASVAVVRAIQEVTGLQAHIKWPNDVLIRGKKVCGILIETAIKGDAVDFAIIGIGMNVNLDPAAFPEISTLATSLSHEVGRDVSRAELAAALLSELEKLYFEARSGTSAYAEWKSHMETTGKRVQIKIGELLEQGTAEAVTENGNLILRRADGTLADIVAGDVTLIKD